MNGAFGEPMMLVYPLVLFDHDDDVIGMRQRALCGSGGGEEENEQ
jgi:hypothetical protein